MAIIIIFLFLFNFIILLTFGRFYGFFGTKTTTLCYLSFTFFLTLFYFYYHTIFIQNIQINLGTWINSKFFEVEWNFIFDHLCLIMLFVVISIAYFVHIFSIAYMEADAHIIRFISYLSFFTVCMLILITAENFIQLFLGWEGVGLCSYLLISFWFTRLQALKSALKAIIVNRISDFSLTIGILFNFSQILSINFSLIFANISFFNTIQFFFMTHFNYITIITLLLYIGAVGKSAQILLHTWLPHAMEGPTPVSALIHAATMVTAGVYLIIKCSIIFEQSKTILLIITISGIFTALYSATNGIVLTDFKRIIAYSTCSQLGYMIFTCGLSAYQLSLFHLMNHAFFKAVLFLCAGSVIHALNNEQDIRKFGQLLNILPITYHSILIASLAIIGFPFLTGYYSKDIILEIAGGTLESQTLNIYWLAIVTAGLTTFYSIRLLFFVFFNNINTNKIWIKKIHEANTLISFVLIFLTYCSIFYGFLFKDLLIGAGNIFFEMIFVSLKQFLLFDTEFLTIIFKNLPIILGFIIIWLFIKYINIYFEINFFYKQIPHKIITFLSNNWNFDQIYNNYINIYILYISKHFFYKILDKGILEYFGPFGIQKLTKIIYILINKSNTGNLNYYIIFMLSFVFIFIYLFKIVTIEILMFFPFFWLKEKIQLHKIYFILIFRHVISYYFMMLKNYSFRTKNTFYYWSILKDESAWTRRYYDMLEIFFTLSKWEEDFWVEDVLDNYQPNILYTFVLERYAPIYHVPNNDLFIYSGIFEPEFDPMHDSWVWADESNDKINLKSTVFLVGATLVNEEKMWENLNQHGLVNNKFQEIIPSLAFMTDVNDPEINRKRDWDIFIDCEIEMFSAYGYLDSFVFHEEKQPYSWVRWAHANLGGEKPEAKFGFQLSSVGILLMGLDFVVDKQFFRIYNIMQYKQIPIYDQTFRLYVRYHQYWHKVYRYFKIQIRYFFRLTIDIQRKFIKKKYIKFFENKTNKYTYDEKHAVSLIGGELRDFSLVADQTDFEENLYDTHWNKIFLFYKTQTMLLTDNPFLVNNSIEVMNIFDSFQNEDNDAFLNYELSISLLRMNQTSFWNWIDIHKITYFILLFEAIRQYVQTFHSQIYELFQIFKFLLLVVCFTISITFILPFFLIISLFFKEICIIFSQLLINPFFVIIQILFAFIFNAIMAFLNIFNINNIFFNYSAYPIKTIFYCNFSGIFTALIFYLIFYLLLQYIYFNVFIPSISKYFNYTIAYILKKILKFFYMQFYMLFIHNIFILPIMVPRSELFAKYTKQEDITIDQISETHQVITISDKWLKAQFKREFKEEMEYLDRYPYWYLIETHDTFKQVNKTFRGHLYFTMYYFWYSFKGAVLKFWNIYLKDYYKKYLAKYVELLDEKINDYLYDINEYIHNSWYIQKLKDWILGNFYLKKQKPWHKNKHFINKWVRVSKKKNTHIFWDSDEEPEKEIVIKNWLGMVIKRIKVGPKMEFKRYLKPEYKIRWAFKNVSWYARNLFFFKIWDQHMATNKSYSIIKLNNEAKWRTLNKYLRRHKRSIQSTRLNYKPLYKYYKILEKNRPKYFVTNQNKKIYNYLVKKYNFKYAQVKFDHHFKRAIRRKFAVSKNNY